MVLLRLPPQFRPTKRLASSRKLFGVLCLALLATAMLVGSPVRAENGMNMMVGTALKSAPLDTMTRAGAEQEPVQSRYKGGNIPISRKLLPEVTATTVPLSRTPSQPPRLDDPMAATWHFHLARQAATKGETDKAKSEIASARKSDPTKSTYQWWQLTQSMRQVDTPTLTQVIPSLIQTLTGSSLARARAGVQLHQITILATGWFWMVLVIGLYLSRWTHLAHDLGAMIFKDPSHRLRLWLPLVLPLAFMVIKPGWFGFLALMSIPLLIQTRGSARVLLAAVWVVGLALVYPAWPWLRNAVPALDPHSEVVLLEKACTLPPSGPIAESLRQRLKVAEDPQRKVRLNNALAIQEARRGNYNRSDRYYRKVLEFDKTNFPALIGMANNTYYRGKMDSAAEQYNQASQHHPNRGEAPFNLAQVYFKKLFVPEAADALEKARKLGFKAESEASPNTRRQGYSPVVYPPLTDQSMAKACAFEAANYENLVTISAWRYFLSSLPWPLFLIIGVPLVVATLLVLWVSHQNDPSECENCGVPLCRDCAFIHDGAWLCSGCGETAQRSQSDMVLATLFKNKSRSEGLKHQQRVVNLGKILPGTGHLVSGQFLAGWLRLSLVALGLFFMCGGWAFDAGAEWSTPGLRLPNEVFHPHYLPLPAGAWTGWNGLAFLCGLACMALAWGIGLTDGSKLSKSIPERTSLVPNGVANPNETQPTADTYQGSGNSLGIG